MDDRAAMDQYLLVAAILWAFFGVCLLALIAGLLLAQHRPQRRTGLTVLLMAIVGILAFSFVGGFSVGRFTAVIAVLATGYMVATGRGPLAVGASMVGAALLYLAFSWLFTPLVLSGGIFALLFGAWAIPVYGLLAVAAFVWAITNPPRSHALSQPHSS